MLKQKLKLFILAFSAFCLVCVPLYAQARGTFIPCGGYNEDGSKEAPCTIVDFFVLIAKVTNWLIAMVGVYAVFSLISQGIWFILSMGNEEAIKKRKDAVLYSVLGFIFALMAFLFINTSANYLLHSKCPIDLTQPLTYLTIQDYDTCK